MSDQGAVVIVGAGPGIGAAVAWRFGREGHAVGLIARDAARLDRLVHDLQADGVRAASAVADARQAAQLRGAVNAIAEEMGPIDVLCYAPLPDVTGIKPVLSTTPADLAASIELSVIGSAAAVEAVLPSMRAHGRGTLLFTTGSAALTPSADRATSGVAYAAQTAYVRMLHDALAPEAVHVAQTVIVGPVGPGQKHEPATVADHLWQQHLRRDEPLTVLR